MEHIAYSLIYQRIWAIPAVSILDVNFISNFLLPDFKIGIVLASFKELGNMPSVAEELPISLI